MNRLREEERLRRKRFAATHTLKECAAEWSLGYSGASHYCRKLGVTPVPEKQRRKGERLAFAKKHTVDECAKAWKCDKYTASYYIVKNGGTVIRTYNSKPIQKKKVNARQYKRENREKYQGFSLYKKMELIPVYPETISTYELGILAANLPNDAILCEPSRGQIAFPDEKYKKRWLKDHKEEI